MQTSPPSAHEVAEMEAVAAELDLERLRKEGGESMPAARVCRKNRNILSASMGIGQRRSGTDATSSKRAVDIRVELAPVQASSWATALKSNHSCMPVTVRLGPSTAPKYPAGY